ncbi:MAG: hypothetical protein ABSF77_06275 [Spirochaetia bacterium]
MENAFPLERQFHLSHVLLRNRLGRARLSPSHLEYRRQEPGTGESIVADGQPDAKGDETQPPIKKNRDVFDGGKSFQGNHDFHAWFRLFYPETDRPTADRQDAEWRYHLPVSPSEGSHGSRDEKELAEPFSFTAIPESLHCSARNVFCSTRRVREHIEHASKIRALFAFGAGQLPAFSQVPLLPSAFLKLQKVDIRSFQCANSL